MIVEALNTSLHEFLDVSKEFSDTGHAA
jgi:hypothetical protein